ncbi:hypothetical protein [Massilia timonae]|uniref:hypothetical protein n=1 Tax=Massilia timonae TaxID=47229 RepID=UPI0028D849DE|nr:hypothetical protein [Massilia timonae]
MDPPFLRERAAAEAAAARVSAYGVGWKERLGLLALGAIVILAGLIVYRVAVPSESQVHDRKVSAALLACQKRIVGLVELGGAEMPPYSKNWAKGDEFHFAWPTGSFHFKNGFGAAVPMSASCTGRISTGQIEQLTLNGKTIL